MNSSSTRTTSDGHPHEIDVSIVEDQRYRAMERSDLQQLSTLLDEELVYSHSDASRDTKESYLNRVRQGVYAYISISTLERNVKCIGSSFDVACCIGHMRMLGRLNGQPKEIDNRYLAVYVRRADGWKLLRYQPTPARSDERRS